MKNQIVIKPKVQSDHSTVFDVEITQDNNTISFPAHDIIHSSDIADKLKEWTGFEIIDETGYLLN